jgi:hypothetical protein
MTLMRLITIKYFNRLTALIYIYIYIYIYMNKIHIDDMALYLYSHQCTNLEFNRSFRCFEEVWWSLYIIKNNQIYIPK